MATIIGDAPAAGRLPRGWGLDNQTGILTDVLLGAPDNLEWLPINSIARMALRNRTKLGTTWSKQRALARRCLRGRVRAVRTRLVRRERHSPRACQLPGVRAVRRQPRLTRWRSILSMAANTTVNARLRAEGLDVVEIEYDQMALCGGGVHCSCHELRRDPA